MKALVQLVVGAAVGLVVSGCMVEKSDDSRVKFDNRDSSDRDSSDRSFYHKYNFSNRGKDIEIVIKIDRDRGGEFTDLHVIDPRTKSPINSIPLHSVSQAATGSEGDLSYYLFTGESYTGQGGQYRIGYEGNLAKVSATELSNKPPEIKFVNFPRENGRDVTWQGRASQKLTNRDWQQLASQRPRAPSVTEPSKLPTNLNRWLDNTLEGLGAPATPVRKQEHNRAITIGGKIYYGAVYEVWDDETHCWMQIWGLDNIEVVEFLYERRNSIRLHRDYEDYAKKGSEVKIICSGGAGDFKLSCDGDQRKDQAVFRVANNKLVIEDNDGGAVHIDNIGRCYNGFP